MIEKFSPDNSDHGKNRGRRPVDADTIPAELGNVLPAAECEKLEAELRDITEKVEGAQSIPTVQDKIWLLAPRVEGLEAMLANRKHEHLHIEAQFTEFRKFPKALSAHKSELICSIGRLEAAASDAVGSYYRTLVRFDESIAACEWFELTASGKTATAGARVEKSAERIKAIETELTPARSELQSLRDRVKDAEAAVSRQLENQRDWSQSA